MFPDGICRVTDTFYTKTVQFQDINYQLSQNEDKTAIFEGWSDFLNYFESSIRFQLSFLNLSASQDGFSRNIVIPLQKDGFDDVRQEYSDMLQNQLSKGNNGLAKTKYLTFGIDGENIRTAKPRLERIETDILNNFKRLGVTAAPMSGAERLRLFHAIFHMDGQETFRFSWDWLAPSGLSTKDFIAPSSFEFRNGRMFRMGKKADFLLSLCELILGGKEGLQPIERTVIDRCVRLVYREMALGLETAQTPLLQDLYEELLKQPEPEAKRVATALELYCTGSLNLFNHPTNVKTRSRVVCIVLKGMGENLRKIAMHITNEFVTQAVDDNHRAGVATWCYFDEFHVLLRDPLTASYFVAVWKMLRKKGCVPSALTQNVKDLLASREIENILDNTDFMVLLSQAQSDRAILAKQLGISEHQLSYITHSNSGEGLLFYGNVTIPFVDRFPRGEIYDLLTTRPEDMAHERKDG